MTEKPTFYALINPVPGLPEQEQRGLVARFTPKEYFVVGKDGDLDDLHKLMRPGRCWAVTYTGLLAEQHGSKQSRVDSMIATKFAIHKRGGVVIEASGRRSDKQWPAMCRAGIEMCRRLAQGAKSALNGTRGTPPLAKRLTDDHLRDMLLIKADREKYPNWDSRLAAMKKREINPLPGRLWFMYQLENVARARGFLE